MAEGSTISFDQPEPANTESVLAMVRGLAGPPIRSDAT
jgi:hypothetical protein